MTTQNVTAEIQGAPADLSVANGSYDAVSLGSLGPDRLAEILAAMTMLAPPAGDDACWPNLIVHGPAGDFTYSLADETGGIADEDGNPVTDIAAVVETVTGQPFEGVVPAHRRGKASNAGKRGTSGVPTSGAAGVTEPAIQSGGHSSTVTTADSRYRSAVGPRGAFVPKSARGETASQADLPSPDARASSAAAASSTGAAGLDTAAAELLHLLDNPLRLSEYRRRFPHVVAGSRDAEYRRIADLIAEANVQPELKARLQNHPPRDWALERPGLFRRFMSLVIDLPLYFVFMLIGAAVVQTVVKPDTGDGPPIQALLIVGWLLASIVLYFVGLEWLLQASPGGMLVGLRVVDERGDRPSLFLCIKRQLLRVFRFAGVALIAFLGSKRDASRGMRMGTVAGGLASGGGDEVVLS